MERQNRDRRAELDVDVRAAAQHDRGRVRNRSTIEKEVMLGEPEAVEAELLGELDLLEHLPIVDVERGLAIREVRGQQVHMKTHWDRLKAFMLPGGPLLPF